MGIIIYIFERKYDLSTVSLDKTFEPFYETNYTTPHMQLAVLVKRTVSTLWVENELFAQNLNKYFNPETNTQWS